MPNPQKPKRVRVEPAPAKSHTYERDGVPEHVMIFLHDLIERTMESETDDAISQLLSIGELTRHHPCLRAEAKAFAGLRDFHGLVQYLRWAKNAH